MTNKLFIESTAHLSNDDARLWSKDSFMITPFHTLIKIDVYDELLEEELLEEDEIDKVEEVGHIISHTFNLDYSESNLAFLAEEQSSDLGYAFSFIKKEKKIYLFDTFFTLMKCLSNLNIEDMDMELKH
jgi:hypothetical protein